MLTLYNELFKKTGKTEPLIKGTQMANDGKKLISAPFTVAKIGPYLLHFSKNEYARECRAIFER